MSVLKVLQNFRTQQKAFLSAIGAVNPHGPMLEIFDMEKCKPHLSQQLAFQVQFFSKGQGVHRTIIDEGASTCIMYTSF